MPCKGCLFESEEKSQLFNTPFFDPLASGSTVGDGGIQRELTNSGNHCRQAVATARAKVILKTKPLKNRSRFHRENCLGTLARKTRKNDRDQSRYDLGIAVTAKTQHGSENAAFAFLVPFANQPHRRDAATHKILLDPFGIMDVRQLPSQLNEEPELVLSLR